MGFQKGDIDVSISHQTFRLRLTLGALAEIDSRLASSGPQSLSAQLRTLKPQHGRALLACLMRPCLPRGVCAERSAAKFSDADIARAMPAMCRLFEEAFCDD